MLGSIHELALVLITVALFAGVVEAGFRLGVRYRCEDLEAQKAHITSLQGALLGLLALLLAFTFSMAISRFDTRKALVLEEANAIGTTYLRSGFLAEPLQAEVKGLLRAYVGARLAFYDAGVDRARIEAATADASSIADTLWKAAITAAGGDARSVPAGLFIQSLNDVIDVNEKRLVAFENHVPDAVLYLLFVASAVSLGFLAFGFGLNGRRFYVSTTLFAVLIALVIASIVDIDRPRRGLIKVGQDSLKRLQTTLAQGETMQ